MPAHDVRFNTANTQHETEQKEGGLLSTEWGAQYCHGMNSTNTDLQDQSHPHLNPSVPVKRHTETQRADEHVGGAQEKGVGLALLGIKSQSTATVTKTVRFWCWDRDPGQWT